MTSAWIALAALLGCTGTAVTPSDGAPPPVDTDVPVTERPVTDTIPAFYGTVPKNLIVVSIDTLRRDRVGAYDPGSMPYLEDIMNQGFTLDNHMECANWTFMGMTCSVNGRHNEENGYIPELTAERPGLPDGPTLAGALVDHGYYTIVGSGNSWFSEQWNNAQGYIENALLSGGATQISNSTIGILTDAQARGDVPGNWLLHMHLMEPHAPYAPPDEYLLGEEVLPPLPGKWDLALKADHYAATATWPALSPDEQVALQAHLEFRYQAELTWLDDQLKTLWATLEAKGLLDDAMVVIFNDHGEQIWDHGKQSHAWGLYREENDGVMILWAKNIVPGHWVGPTSQIDIAPTLLALEGAAIPPEMTGIPLGQAADDRPTFALTSARQGTVQSVRQSGIKLLFNWGDGSLEMYDLAEDPLELNNVFDATDPVALQLWDLLQPHIALALPIVLDQAPVWPPGLPHP